jgi:predicted AlkP superfamily phosphohydrolase/phosphomutase
VRRKVIVVGIDGGTFDIIMPMVQNGKLPHIASLMNEGVRAELKSTIPPVTAQAWVSFMTGKNPGKHGVFGFQEHPSSGYNRPFINASSIRSKTLWNILTENGRKLGLLNVPITYPAEKVNGFIIPGMLGVPAAARKENLSFTYPPELYREILENVGPYQIGYFPGKVALSKVRDKYIENWSKITELRKKVTLYLMQRFEWDFFMVVFKSTDIIQHHFWRYYDQGHPDYDLPLAEKYGGVIPDFYQKVDRAIGEILEPLPSSTTVILMSDHGFGPLHKRVFLNRWLIEKRLLKLKASTLPLLKYKFHPLVYKLLHRIGYGGVGGVFPNDSDVDPRDFLNIPHFIDWPKTKAYSGSPTEQGLYINLKGREPSGIVRPGDEYENLRDFLIDQLYEIRDESGQRLVETVYKKEDIYTGPYLGQAPDIFVIFRKSEYAIYNGIYQKNLLEEVKKVSGTHRMNGIFLMKGEGLKRNGLLRGCHIMDIAPTVLYLLGLPIPDDMDGKVLTDAFGPQYLNVNKIVFSTPVSPVKYETRDVYSSEEAEKIREELKSLGYID